MADNKTIIIKIVLKSGIEFHLSFKLLLKYDYINNTKLSVIIHQLKKKHEKRIQTSNLKRVLNDTRATNPDARRVVGFRYPLSCLLISSNILTEPLGWSDINVLMYSAIDKNI